MFVLIHSPLVGSFTWKLVADEFQRQGIDVVVPTLPVSEKAAPPYWKQYASAVSRTLESVPPEQSLILVGHSGAGMLLPAIRQIANRTVAAYIFVDAAIPEDGKSLFDLFNMPEMVEQLRQSASGGFLPTWSDEELRDVIPDAAIRGKFVAELRPLPLAVCEEPVPVFNGWSDAPCGYLRFGSNPAYDAPAERAQREGWEYVELDGGHFQMLVEPSAVTNALIEIVKRMGAAVIGLCER